MQSLRTLRSLHFHLAVPTFSRISENVDHIRSGLLNTLSSLSKDLEGHPPLEQVVISVNLEAKAFRGFPISFCANLDSILASLASVQVHVVTLTSNTLPHHKFTPPDWRTLLPTLDEAGRLTLTSTSDLDFMR